MKHSFPKKLIAFALAIFTVLSVLVAVPIFTMGVSAAEYTGTGNFVQCTGELASGYYVFGGGSAENVSAINNTVGASWIKFTATTSTNGSIANPDTSIVWYYDAEAGTFKNGDNYIYWPSTGNTGGVGTKNTPVTVTETATAGVYNITVTATPARFLRLNGTSGYRFYSSNTGTNTFYFFKLDESAPACQHTNKTGVPAVDADCTTPGNIAYSTCDECGAFFNEVGEQISSADTVVAALGHNYVNGVCSRCNEVAPLNYTFDYTTGTNQTVMTGEQEGLITLVFDKASGSTLPTWYESGTALRFYKNNNLKISTVEGYYIKSVTLTITEGSLAADTGTLASGEWTPADHQTSTVIFTPSETTRVQQISIKLAAICKHTNPVAIGEAKDATCTEEGITAGSKCADCGEILEEQATIDALNHNFVGGVCINEGCGEIACDHIDKGITLGEITKDPTCTENGLQEQFCAQCGQPLEDKVLDIIAHTSVTDEAVAPTCIATGLTEGSHCSVCGEVLVEQTEVPVVDHNYVDNQCTVCGDIIVTGTQLADFEFGANGDAAHKDGSSIAEGTKYTSGNYTLALTSLANVYGNAFDAKGNSALKLGTSSKAASFSFTVGSNVETVVFHVAAYKANTAKLEINGTAYEITSKSDEGAYTKIVVDTTTQKTVTLVTVSGGYRAMVDSIEFWGDPIPAVTGMALTLNKGVTVKVTYDIPAAWLNANTGAMIVFSNGTELEAKAGVNTYTTDLTPAQINSALTVQLTGMEAQDVSVATYIAKVNAASYTALNISEEKYNALVDLLAAIETYGDAADKSLSENLTEETFDGVTGSTTEGAADIITGGSATLAEQATLKLNVNTANIQDGYTLSVKLGDKVLVEAGTLMANFITADKQIVINGLYPVHFNDTITITVSNAEGVVTTVSFTFNSYLKALYAASADDQAMLNLVAATYRYGVAAEAYKAS